MYTVHYIVILYDCYQYYYVVYCMTVISITM